MAPVWLLRRNNNPERPFNSLALAVRPSGRETIVASSEIQTCFDDAVVAEGDTQPGVGAQQAPLSDRHSLLAAA
jgi:hypothetical protein